MVGIELPPHQLGSSFRGLAERTALDRIRQSPPAARTHFANTFHHRYLPSISHPTVTLGGRWLLRAQVCRASNEIAESNRFPRAPVEKPTQRGVH